MAISLGIDIVVLLKSLLEDEHEVVLRPEGIDGEGQKLTD